MTTGRPHPIAQMKRREAQAVRRAAEREAQRLECEADLIEAWAAYRKGVAPKPTERL